LATTALAPAYGAVPYRSWGMAGVAFDRYRSDAIACGRLGANADIRDEAATKAFVATEQWSDRNLNNPAVGIDPIREQALMVGRLRPAKRLAEVQGAHVGVMEQCLASLGYTRFTLTREQVRALGRLRPGTPERHAYLHRLASDPSVLRDQAVRGG